MNATSSMISAELFTIPHESGFLVYAPIRRAAFVANAATVNRIADLVDGVADVNDPETAELVGFLRRLEIVDGGPEVPPITQFSGDPRPTEVTLFMTTACNLRCTYCYASAGETPGQLMPLDVARRGIDFVVANAIELGRNEVELNFHGGGEATLNWDTLVGSYEYAREIAEPHGIRIGAYLATNGVMSDEKLDWIVEHLDGVSLSFDGLPEVNDKHRLTVLGEGSSPAIIRTIDRFDEAEFPYGLRLTVTTDQIERLPDSVEYVCSRFRTQRLQVEPAYQLGRWSDAPSAETQDFVEAFRTAQRIARAHGREINFSGARVGTLTNHFCGVTQDGFALTADGHVSACYEVFLSRMPGAEAYVYGEYDEPSGRYEFDLPILNQLRNETVDQRDFCRGCFAKWSCGGDCSHKAMVVNGTREFAGSERCHVIRELTKDQIVDRIERAGGLFWHAPPDEVAESAARGKEILV